MRVRFRSARIQSLVVIGILGSALSACSLFISVDDELTPSQVQDAGAVADAGNPILDAGSVDSASPDSSASPDADSGPSARCGLEDLLQGKGTGVALLTSWSATTQLVATYVADAGAGNSAVQLFNPVGLNSYYVFKLAVPVVQGESYYHKTLVARATATFGQGLDVGGVSIGGATLSAIPTSACYEAQYTANQTGAGTLQFGLGGTPQEQYIDLRATYLYRLPEGGTLPRECVCP
jgi:hypothetical protein